MIILNISDEDVGRRIDKIVRKNLSFCPLGEIFRLFRDKKILFDGKKLKENDRVAQIGEIHILVNEDELRNKFAVKLENKSKSNLQIVYEDENLLVCDKPATIATQPGKGIPVGASLIEIAQNYAEQKFTPHLAHRIDKDTSGLVLIAKSADFLRKVQNIWNSPLLKKEYLALCHNIFDKKTGKIESNLERQGLKMNVSESGGKNCVSHFKQLKEIENISLIAVEIETGRMHQIRTQFSHIKHCIVGDKKYGDLSLDKEIEEKFGVKINRLMLHSHKISFKLEKKNYSFEAPVPKEFLAFTNRK